jgi:hypothetical protein
MSKLTNSVTLSRQNYEKLKRLGYAEETMDDVVVRVLQVVEQVTEEEK